MKEKDSAKNSAKYAACVKEKRYLKSQRKTKRIKKRD